MTTRAELIVRMPDGAMRTFPLEESCRLGRTADNDLAFPGMGELSRRHLAIERSAGGWSVRDLGSRNGTFLNGAAVSSPARLRPGDLIRAGKLMIEFRSGGQTPRETGAAEAATIAIRLGDVLGGTPDDGGPGPMPLTSARHLQALMHAGAELCGRIPLAQLLPLILDLAAGAVQAPRGALMLEEEGGLSECAVRGGSFPVSASVSGRVLQGRESLLIQDMQREESLRLQASIIEQRVRSLLAVPLQTRDRVIGLLYLDSAGQAREFTREDLGLITVMANMAAVAIENARLAEVEERERRVRLEMEQAAAIQRMLLPAAPPSVAGLDIAAFSRPCHQAGGDYYDFFSRPGGRLGILVGDVSGKGMPAALLMASLQARVQVLLEEEEDPARLVQRLNRITAAHSPGNRFVTLFYGELDPGAGGLRYVNAGHNPPLILRADGAADRLEAGGLLLGILPHAAYEAGLARLDPGDTLLLYSDGVTDAAPPGGAGEFGEARLAEAAAAAGGLAAAEVLERVVDSVARFAGAVSGADDFTLIVVRKTAAA